MTILTFSKKEFEAKVGKFTKEIEEKITMMGTPIDSVDGDEISAEVFPNRPDLLSFQNFTRAVLMFIGKKSIQKFNLNKPEKNLIVNVEKAVKGVRPYTVCAVAKDLKLDDSKIKELIDLQEKLHGSIGRKRKKLAIGIYPLDKIKFPIRFTSKRFDEISFVPLESKKEMNAKSILKNHPAGIEYGHLLEGHQVYPVFIDADGKILSMPPIINSDETGRINEKTKEVFIECSGFNLHYLNKALNIIVSTLIEMNAKVYQVNVKDSSGNFISPDMSSQEVKFKLEDVNKTLGLSLTEKQIKTYLAKMGIDFMSSKSGYTALVPALRTEILHWIDLTEEIAIAYGYENFVPEVPKISTIAQADISEKRKNTISTILSSLGLIETSSFHLTNKKDIKKMHFDFKEFLEIENSKTERDTLRMDILSNLLQILSENSNSSYPQKIFEIGVTFSKDKSNKTETGVNEKCSLAIALTDEVISFTDAVQVLEYLFKMLDEEFKIEQVENSNYIAGRVGRILVSGKEIGFIGEIAPRVLRNWKFKMPVASIEIDLEFLLGSRNNL